MSRICSGLLFIHAITGCDTTSRLYGISKTASLSKIQCSDEFTKISKAFMQDNAKKDDIINAGKNSLSLVLLYNRDSEGDYDNNKVDANDLPPTSPHQPSSIVLEYTTRFKSGGEKLDWVGKAENR